MANEAARKVGRWFLWSVSYSLVPYAAAVMFWWFNLSNTMGLDFARILGSGAVFITCIGLVAGGLKEMAGVEVRPRLYGAVLAFGSLFLVLLGAAYGMAASELLAGQVTPPPKQDTIVIASIGAAVITLLITIVAVATSASATKEAK